MLEVRDIPEPGSVDVQEDGLLLPVPGTERDTVLLEERDGHQLVHISATGVMVAHNGMIVDEWTDVQIVMLITDARVAFASSKYLGMSKMRGGGAPSLLLVSAAVSAVDYAVETHECRGKMLVGQLRYPWIAQVGSSTKFGWGHQPQERLYLQVAAADGPTRLAVTLAPDETAARIAAGIARRTAAFRLRCDEELDGETRRSLEDLATVKELAQKRDTVRSFVFPTYWTVDEASARMGMTDGGDSAGGDSAVESDRRPHADPAAAGQGLTLRRACDDPSLTEASSVLRSTCCDMCGSRVTASWAYCRQCGAYLGR